MANHERSPTPRTEVEPDGIPEQVPPSPDELEQSIEDQQNRVRDAEILGKSFRVRLAIDRSAGAAISAAHDKVAKASNLLSTPKNAYLNMRHNAAIARHSRKEDKANTARENARSAREMADNSPNRVFKGKWRANRLEKKANKLTDKANNYKRDVLDARAGAYNDHTAMMKGRTERADKTREDQKSIHERKIAMFKDRKTLAKGNKEIRKLRREMIQKNKSENVRNRIDVNAKFNNIPLEQRKRLGEICCLREVAQRGADDVARQKRQLESRQRGNNESLEVNIQSVIDKTKTRDKAARNAREAEELHTGFTETANDLQQQLDRGSDHEGTELTETGRANLEHALQEALGNAEQAAQRAQEFKAQASRLDAEINSLERDISKQENKVDQYENALKSVNNTLQNGNSRANTLDAEYQNAVDALGNAPTQEQPQPSPSPTPSAATPQPTASSDNVIDLQAARADRQQPPNPTDGESRAA